MEGKSKQGSRQHPNLPIIQLVFMHEAGELQKSLPKAKFTPAIALLTSVALHMRQVLSFLHAFPREKLGYPASRRWAASEQVGVTKLPGQQ